MKNITYAFLIFLMAFQAQAQEEIRLGIKLGANLATVSGDDLESDFLFGHHIGGFAEVQINEKFSFVPEMIFSIQGYQSTVSEGDDLGEEISASVDMDETLRLSYLNFPLLGRFHINENFYAEAGLQIGFLMGAKFESTFTSTIEFPGFDEDGNSITISEEVEQTSELNVRDRFENIDFGVNIGTGGYITDNIMLGLRYYLGLSEIDNQNMGFSNQVIMASAGFRF